MSESLYVCLFSNDHVKVGRSKNPATRVAQHAERVAVMGVSLLQWTAFPCERGIGAAEAWLIRQCADEAATVRGNEWFEGLPFAVACLLAEQAAKGAEFREEAITDGPRPDFPAVVRALSASGYRQTDLARICGISQSSMSDIATGVTTDPSYSVGYQLMLLFREEASLTDAITESAVAALTEPTPGVH